MNLLRKKSFPAYEYVVRTKAATKLWRLDSTEHDKGQMQNTYDHRGQARPRGKRNKKPAPGRLYCFRVCAMMVQPQVDMHMHAKAAVNDEQISLITS
jgi:hypothetical protein